MRDRALFIFILFLIQVGLSSSVQAQNVGSEKLREAREHMLETGRYSTDLPNVEKLPRREGVSRKPSDLRLVWTALKILGGILLVAILAFLLLQFFASRRSRNRNQQAQVNKAAAEDGILRDVVVDIDLASIDALANSGLYGEAIHQLLLRTISELVRLARLTIKSAWTSREIAESIPLSESVKVDLIGLVHSAELAHFADVDSSAGDYQAARSAFDRLVLGLSREKS